jgi:uncharacterized protein
VDALDLRAMAEAAKAAFKLPTHSIHGPAHWLRVMRNGREIVARTPQADGFVVDLFALLHDCQRRDDGADLGHGRRAADFVTALGRAGRLMLSQAQIVALVTACADHERGRTTPDPTIGACWDADRLDLARLGRRPIGRLLSTAAARDPEIQAGAWQRGVAGRVDADLATACGMGVRGLA